MYKLTTSNQCSAPAIAISALEDHKALFWSLDKVSGRDCRAQVELHGKHVSKS